MKLLYNLEIDKPETHYANIRLSGEWGDSDDELTFYLPCWSPGSYLMREYARNILYFKASQASGKHYLFEQIDKNSWKVKREKKTKGETFSIEYRIYCKEVSVRTSYIDINHAFIHGPSVFMGVLGKELKPTLKINFPPIWSKVSTGLKDVESDNRGDFIYTADNYDDFIDSPIEIGCHETDGFRVSGKDHHLCFYGGELPHKNEVKADIQKIVQHISDTMGDIPYEKYQFITHFIPNAFGGLEHNNSTALIFCPFKFSERKGYRNWLELVSHEYFHTWNVKRIRPRELGPFDYNNENYTSMHWLTEGLTSLMDRLFVLRSGLVSLEEYLEEMTADFKKYFDNQGKKFHSLEASSFNAWVKLYRADENFNNSSVSYYLKGGIVFFVLNILLVKEGKSINDLLKALWASYKANPKQGLIKEDVYKMIKDLAGDKVLDAFDTYITTTEDIDLSSYLSEMGLSFVYEQEDKTLSELGFTTEIKNSSVFIKTVVLDGQAYRYGLNAGDELLAINGMRVDEANIDNYEKILRPNEKYQFLVSRLGYVQNIEVVTSHKKQSLKSIEIKDRALAMKFLNPSMS